MKVLLDENLPHDMRLEITGHEIFIVAFMGWVGIANGELLRHAAGEGFDAVITNDRGLEFEQNQTNLPVAVVVLLVKGNNIELIRPLYPNLLRTLGSLRPRTLVKVGIEA